MENRKAFNFYRSYYDVIQQLETDKDKLDFILALLNKQFNDIEPSLTGMAKFAYISQKHSIDSQIQGYKSKVGYEPPSIPPMEGPTQPPTEGPLYVAGNITMTTEPPTQPPSVQEQGQGEEKEEEKEQLEVQVKELLEKLNIK